MSKFNIAHFPNGTVFQIGTSALFGNKDAQKVFTVANIVRNGVDSYVLQTTTRDEQLNAASRTEMMSSYNIVHVESIIKRGDGPVSVDHNRYGLGTVVQNNSHINQDYYYWHQKQEKKYSSGKYVGYDMQGLIISILIKQGTNPAGMYDYGAFASLIYDQSWCHDKKSNVFCFYICDKKRLKKFVKQNKNRFLMNVKKTAAIIYKQEMDDYYKDMEDDLDHGSRRGWVGEVDELIRTYKVLNEGGTEPDDSDLPPHPEFEEMLIAADHVDPLFTPEEMHATENHSLNSDADGSYPDDSDWTPTHEVDLPKNDICQSNEKTLSDIMSSAFGSIATYQNGLEWQDRLAEVDADVSYQNNLKTQNGLSY